MKIQTIGTIDAPAPAVWQVLGEQFGEVSKWADAIIASSVDRPLGQGAVRTCDLKATGPLPAGQITEELTHFNSGAQSMTYVVRSGVPGFMRHLENAWTVKATDDGRSMVTSEVTLRVAWYMLPMTPVIRNQLGGTLQSFIGQLKKTVEG